MNPYDDIIDLPRHVSSVHPQMAVIDRAAQFSPFAALTGYDAAIEETARLTEEKREHSEASCIELNEKLRILADCMDIRPQVTILRFEPDTKKTGGAYVRVSGIVKKIRAYEREILMQDGTIIPMDEIMEIGGAIFDGIEF